MQLIKRFFYFYLDSSIHTALSVICLYFTFSQKLNIEINFPYAFFLFGSTIVCYNFMKYGVEAEKYLIVKNSYQKYIQIFSFLLFGSSCYTFLQLPYDLYAPILFLTVLSALYGIPFLPNAKNLRSLAGLKVFLVALVWSGLLVWVPMIENNLPYSTLNLSKIIQVFVIVLILLIPFEIRDLKYDKPDLKTLPQRFGVTFTKKIGYGLVLIYGLLVSVQLFKNNSMVAVEVLFFMLLWLSIANTKKEQSKYYASFWVEGVPVLYLGFWQAFS